MKNEGASKFQNAGGAEDVVPRATHVFRQRVNTRGSAYGPVAGHL